MKIKSSFVLCAVLLAGGSGLLAAGAELAAPQAESVPFFQIIQNKFQHIFSTKKDRNKKRILACAELDLSKQEKTAFQEAYTALENKRDLLILVDPKHVLPKEYLPADMTTALKPGWPKKANLRQEAMAQMLAMIDAAQKDGVRLVPISTYRTWQYQDGLYRNNLARNGGKPSGYVARAGESQHHLGTAVDFNTVSPKDENIPPLVWLRNHAGEYGFSLSFPKGAAAEQESGYPYEAWHYRYITQDAVRLQDKFFGGDQHKTLKFLHDCVFNAQPAKQTK